MMDFEWLREKMHGARTQHYRFSLDRELTPDEICRWLNDRNRANPCIVICRSPFVYFNRQMIAIEDALQHENENVHKLAQTHVEAAK